MQAQTKKQQKKKITISPYDRERVDNLLDSMGWRASWISDVVRAEVLQHLKEKGKP
jgi:hypothetical protein